MFVRRGDVLFQSTKKFKGSTMRNAIASGSAHDPFIEQLRGPITQDVMDTLRERNAARVRKIIKEMGNKWIGHPDHKIKVAFKKEVG